MKLWFSIFDNQNYKGEEPPFFDIDDLVNWKKTILENRNVIKNEFLELAEAENLFQPYFNQSLTSIENKWKTIGLKFWGINNYKNQKIFPKTTGVLNSIPHLVSASFNKLEAGTDILPHNGDTNGIFRCHLGLIISNDVSEMGFQVKNEKRPWREDDLIVFTDAHVHSAYNHSDIDRYIFLFDIIREEATTKKNKVLSTVLSSMFLQKILLLFKLKEEGKNRSKLKPIVFILRPLALGVKWFVNAFRIY